MKEEEIRAVNNTVIQRAAALLKGELLLNRQEIEIEKRLNQLEEISMKG